MKYRYSISEYNMFHFLNMIEKYSIKNEMYDIDNIDVNTEFSCKYLHSIVSGLPTGMISIYELSGCMYAVIDGLKRFKILYDICTNIKRDFNYGFVFNDDECVIVPFNDNYNINCFPLSSCVNTSSFLKAKRLRDEKYHDLIEVACRDFHMAKIMVCTISGVKDYDYSHIRSVLNAH